MGDAVNEGMADQGSQAGRWFLVFIGVSVLAMGVLFSWLMLNSYLEASASRKWPQVESVVIYSQVETRQISGSPEEYRLKLVHGYGYEGGDYTSEKLSPRGLKWTRSSKEVEELAEKYPAGSIHKAWVDPGNLSNAILKHDSKAAGYTLWFPILFVIAGIGIVLSAFSKKKTSTP